MLRIHKESSFEIVFENKKQRVGVPTRCLTISTGGKSGFAKQARFACISAQKRVYLFCVVRKFFRCVGGIVTYAGAKERQLFCTATLFCFLIE